MTRTTALLAFAVAGLTACGGDKISHPPITSSFDFAYAGAASGTFSVTGTAANTSATGVTGFIDSGIAFVMATKDNSSAGPQLAVLGFSEGSTGNLAFAGAEASEDEMCQTGMMTCAVMIFVVTAMVDGSQHPFMCTLSSGTLSLTVSTSARSTGTFSGAGTCLDMLSESETEEPVAITVSGGSFTTTNGPSPLAGMGMAIR
jgi:hypothetical protein